MQAPHKHVARSRRTSTSRPERLRRSQRSHCGTSQLAHELFHLADAVEVEFVERLVVLEVGDGDSVVLDVWIGRIDRAFDEIEPRYSAVTWSPISAWNAL